MTNTNPVPQSTQWDINTKLRWLIGAAPCLVLLLMGILGYRQYDKVMTEKTAAVADEGMDNLTQRVILGAYYALHALTRPIPAMGECVAFYKVIAGRSLEDYKRTLLELSHDDAMHDMLIYNYSIAVLSKEKFRHIRKSVLCLCVALPVRMLLMLLFALRAAHLRDF